jgi:hypothetical protein
MGFSSFTICFYELVVIRLLQLDVQKMTDIWPNKLSFIVFFVLTSLLTQLTIVCCKQRRVDKALCLAQRTVLYKGIRNGL